VPDPKTGAEAVRLIRSGQKPLAEIAKDMGVSDQLWVSDLTYVPTLAGFLYLAVILDTFSRRVIGWAMGPRPTMQLVIEALDMAIWNRRADPGVIHYSDHGSGASAANLSGRPPKPMRARSTPIRQIVKKLSVHESGNSAATIGAAHPFADVRESCGSEDAIEKGVARDG